MQHRNAFWGRQSLKERVKWCIANERNTGSEYERPWLQQPYSLLFYCHSVSQSLLGWPTFNVKTVPTSSHLFISPSLRETCYPSVFLTWGSLHAALVCFPNFPRAQLESWFNGLHCRDDRRLGVPDRRVCSLQNCNFRGEKKMNIDIFVCCGWQLHAVHNERRRERLMKQMWINLVSNFHRKIVPLYFLPLPKHPRYECVHLVLVVYLETQSVQWWPRVPVHAPVYPITTFAQSWNMILNPIFITCCN